MLVNLDWNTRTAGIDPWPVVTSYLGVVLAGAMFLAIGLFVSSLVRSQLVAAMVALVVSLVFVVAGVLAAGVWTPARCGTEAGRVRQRAGALPPRLHPRGDRHPAVVLYLSVTRSACS